MEQPDRRKPVQLANEDQPYYEIQNGEREVRETRPGVVMPLGPHEIIHNQVVDYLVNHEEMQDWETDIICTDSMVETVGGGLVSVGYNLNHSGYGGGFILTQHAGKLPVELPKKELEQVGESLVKEAFLHELKKAGLIRYDLYDTWRFAPNAIKHILIGHGSQGFHHLPTAIGLESDDRIATSAVHSSDGSTPEISTAIERQRVRDNGVYHCDSVVIDGASKRSGSTMFPDDWNAHKIISSVLDTRLLGTKETANGRTVHRKVIDGVTIRAITDVATRKIITAYPERKANV